jgi:Bacterial archaeo-eukaryotic release factor family 3
MTPAAAMRPTTADLRALLAPHEPPCISLYEPTHCSDPASSQEDPVRYRNLLHRAEASLRERYPARVLRPVLEKLERFASDSDFWMQAVSGLAVFGSADDLKVFKLQQPVPELLAVADRFQIKPLLRSLQRDGRYQVLALTLADAKLYEGTRDTLDPVDLAGAPATIVAALGPERAGPYSTGPREERPLDRERFFRVIDREIMERASTVSRLPLVLAALPEHQAHFRALSHNPFLTATGIAVNPAALTPGELRDAAWKAIEPHFEDRLSALLDAYGEARGHGRASDRLDEITAALAQSRVGTLLLEADRHIPGGAGDYDVLDDLAETALGTGAEVIVLPPDRMPTKTGAAAVFRY